MKPDEQERSRQERIQVRASELGPYIYHIELECYVKSLVETLIDRGIVKGNRQAILDEIQSRANYIKSQCLENLDDAASADEAWERAKDRVQRRRALPSSL